jgi:hypothetical protein
MCYAIVMRVIVRLKNAGDGWTKQLKYKILVFTIVCYVLGEQRSQVTEQYILNILRIGFLGNTFPIVANCEVLEITVNCLQ